MKTQESDVKIFVNHVGFTPSAYKSFVMTDPPQEQFTVLELKDTRYTPVLEGTLTKAVGSELGAGWIGDFSEVNKDGIYQIRCGGARSRLFVIHKEVFDYPLRVLLNFFRSQRCGDSKLGWASPCHLEDGRIAETDEHVNLIGGWHQSSDLRKWSWGIIYGLVGLLQYGLSVSPPWDEGQIADEIRWGCDYFHKLVQPDGRLLDSSFVPLGWGQRDYYASDSPLTASWTTAATQANASRYFEKSDTEYAGKCREVALLVWSYMTSSKRPKGVYRIPVLPPRGHDLIHGLLFDGLYPGSSIDLGQRICAGIALYRLTNEERFLNDARQAATCLLSLQVSSASDEPVGACFWEGPGAERLANSYGYFWNVSGPIGLCELMQLLPDHAQSENWRTSVEKIAEQHRTMSERNPWGLVPTYWECSRSQGGRPARRLPTASTQKSEDGAFYHKYFPSPTTNLEILAVALFLRRASKILGEEEYERIAQRQLDWLLGCNPLDSSTVDGIGYNQPQRGIYGEFFPPTPQIPGAVMVGLMSDEEDELVPLNHHSALHIGVDYGCYMLEYDIPPTGILMWYLSEISRDTDAP